MKNVDLLTESDGIRARLKKAYRIARGLRSRMLNSVGGSLWFFKLWEPHEGSFVFVYSSVMVNGSSTLGCAYRDISSDLAGSRRYGRPTIFFRGGVSTCDSE